jgi:hypothetical protein
MSTESKSNESENSYLSDGKAEFLKEVITTLLEKKKIKKGLLYSIINNILDNETKICDRCANNGSKEARACEGSIRGMSCRWCKATLCREKHIHTYNGGWDVCPCCDTGTGFDGLPSCHHSKHRNEYRNSSSEKDYWKARRDSIELGKGY